jgi:DNA-binding MarR family transcriptional regulator
MTSEDPVWLTPEELHIWQGLHAALTLVPVILDRQLQRDAQLSFLEYYVLAGLSESASGTMRLSDLAMLANAELSRISHLVARLERRGLLHRRPDPDDGRYTNAILTENGRQQVRDAAPGHVTAVRQLIFAGLDEDALGDLRRAVARIVTAVNEAELPLGPTIRAAIGRRAEDFERPPTGDR